MIIKAISENPRWADLIASGNVTLVMRSWQTFYRGKILICASDREQLRPDGKRYPRSCGIALADLVDCRPISAGDSAAAGHTVVLGQFAWVLKNIVRIPEFYVGTQTGLYDVDVPELLIYQACNEEVGV